MTQPKVLNKHRNKFIYYDNARTQMNILWGEVYAMSEAPPGTPYTHEEETGRSQVEKSGRVKREYKGREGIEFFGDDSDGWEIERKRDDTGYLSGMEDSAYHHDSARWNDDEVKEMEEYLNG